MNPNPNPNPNLNSTFARVAVLQKGSECMLSIML